MKNIQDRINELTTEYSRLWTVRGQAARQVEQADREIARLEAAITELSKLLQEPITNTEGKEGTE